MLSDPEIWLTPRKVDQAAFERKSDGSFAGFERTPPFEYHNGYLTVCAASSVAAQRNSSVLIPVCKLTARLSECIKCIPCLIGSMHA